MGKSSPSPPPAPDYAGAATAQGAANVATATAQGFMNNPNVYGPLGNQTVTWNPVGEYQQPTITQSLTPSAQAALTSQQQVQQQLANLGSQGLTQASSILSQPFHYSGPGVQTSLSQSQPRPYNGPGIEPRPYFGPGYGMSEAQAQGPSGAPGVPSAGQYGLAGSNINAGQILQAPELSNYGMAGANVSAQGVNTGPQSGQYGMAGAGPQAGQYGFAGGLNTSNVAAMPVNAGMTGQQAIMNRLAPQLERSDRATQQRLANQGLVPGGEAFENAMISQNQQKNDLLTQAALQGIGLDTAANAQGFNQALQAGQYGNQAIAQNFGQGQAANAAGNQAVGQNFGQGLAAQQAQNAASQQLYNQYMGVQGLQNQAVNQNQQAALAQQQAQLMAQQQGFGQQVTQQNLGNQAIGQNFGQGVTAQQLQNAMQNQQYNQGLQSAQFGNTAQQQDLQQQLLLQNQPLNQILGLMSGSQIQMPQFQGYSGSNVAPPPIFAGAQAAGQSAMDQYGIQSANVNAQNAGLYGLLGTAGGLAMMAPAGTFGFSDRRLKSNIERIGTHLLGIGVYEYNIFDRRERGVMADEVEAVMPEAVVLHPSGYKMVNYGMLT